MLKEKLSQDNTNKKLLPININALFVSLKLGEAGKTCIEKVFLVIQDARINDTVW